MFLQFLANDTHGFEAHILLNRVLWCFQICFDDLKNLLQCLCVLFSRFYFVNIHYKKTCMWWQL